MKQISRPVVGILLLAVVDARAQQDKLGFPDLPGTDHGSFSWPVALSGSSPVVGVQFDLVYPAGQLGTGTALPSATSSVLAAAKEISPGRTRVAVSATNNKPLAKDDILELPLSLTPGSPGGGPAFTIDHVILALADGSKVPVSVQLGPLTEWRKQHFAPEELLEAALIADDADPDGDGVMNLLEYAVGGDPRRPLPGEKPEAAFGVFFDNGQNRLFLAMNFRRALNAPGVRLQPEVSENLAEWFPAEDIIQAGPADETGVPMQARIFLDSNQKQFLKLNVSREVE